MVKLNIKIYGPSLATERCQYWASMAYWNCSDGILLSMGIDPKGESAEEVSEEKAIKLGKEFETRLETYRRFLELNLISSILIPSREMDDDTKYIVYKPADFTKWAITSLSSFPEELYLAVHQKYPGSFQDVNLPKPNSAVKTSEKRMEAIPEKSHNRSEMASDLANARWSPKWKLEAQTEDYIRQEMQKGCNCNHIELADYLPGAVDVNEIYIFDLKHIEEKSYHNTFRKVVLKVFKELAPDRIVGTKNYKKPQPPCSLHKLS